jgi:uncharacterized protein with HEPN domain
MPLHDPKKYLYDIINGCEFILNFTQGKTVENYRNDRIFRSALERELQIVGEAMLQLNHLRPDMAEEISDHRKIRRLTGTLTTRRWTYGARRLRSYQFENRRPL